MQELVNSLFVFMLAGFIGFEVIRRVSPLLHTPLMSLTNALDAIAVVVAPLSRWFSRDRNFATAWEPSRRRRHQQHRRRFPDYRPDAQNVQSRPREEAANIDPQRTLSSNSFTSSPRRFSCCRCAG